MAFLASVDRETTAYREAQRWRLEAELQQLALVEAKRTGRKITFLAAAIGVAGGLVVGGILGMGVQ